MHIDRLLSIACLVQACTSPQSSSPIGYGDADVADQGTPSPDAHDSVNDATGPDADQDAGSSDAPDWANDATAPDSAADTGSACDDLQKALQEAATNTLSTARSQDIAVGVSTDTCPFTGYYAGKSKLTDATTFRLASVTKTYTAAVVLHLVEEGRIALDGSIEDYNLGLPNGDKITVRQLLDHTSGLFDYTKDPLFKTHLDWSPEQRLAAAAAHAVYFQPGEGCRYSNTDYVALGVIAQQVTQLSTMAAIYSADLLVPLGLGHTYFEGEEPVPDLLAPSFDVDGSELPGLAEFSGAWADGAMIASLQDTTRWIRAFASGQITPSFKEDLLQGPFDSSTGLSYGLGTQILSQAATGDVPAYGHVGDMPGFHSLAFDFPGRGYTVTVVLNQDGSDASAVMLAVMDELNKRMPAK